MVQNELNEFLSKSKSTIGVFDGPLNGKLYVVGTAHFSEESQKEVADLIKLTKPNCVVLELCSSRANLLKIDEETIFRDAKNTDIRKLMQLIKQVFTLKYFF
jgi:pheromone shutdown protein TraB